MNHKMLPVPSGRDDRAEVCHFFHGIWRLERVAGGGTGKAKAKGGDICTEVHDKRRPPERFEKRQGLSLEPNRWRDRECDVSAR